MLETNKIYQGDCIEEMKKLPDNSVDAIITDPPYGLEFMGKEWDKFKEGKNIAGGTTGIDTPFGRSKPLNSVYQYGLEEKNQLQKFCFDWAKECLRVLKPGGFLLSFGGTRTYHRMTCGIEDAGFEIRDTIMWVYGSGFPKSLNIGKAVDKLQGNEREVVGKKDINAIKALQKFKEQDGRTIKTDFSNIDIGITKGTSEWEGWGTALKPAVEPIVVARKPLSEKNVALNVLKWGTGGINIDESRVDVADSEKESFAKEWDRFQSGSQEGTVGYVKQDGEYDLNQNRPQGRFPANIILDEEAGRMLDEQSGISKSIQSKRGGNVNSGTERYQWNKGDKENFNLNDAYECGFNDKGGASRFFYCAKASKSERNFGCEEFEDKQKCPMSKESRIGECINASKGMERFETICKNNHPTVKPIKLMEYLIKLVSKENAVILDPFLGSGTTAIACLKTNRKFIGIEKESDYVKIAEARIKPYLSQQKLIC